MRSSRPTTHGRLARWFYALINARHGVLLGAPLAAALIMMLVLQGGVGGVSEDQPSGQVVLRWEVYNAGHVVSMPSTEAERPSVGGGIFNSGALTLHGSTVSGNVAQGGVEASVPPATPHGALVRILTLSSDSVPYSSINSRWRVFNAGAVTWGSGYRVTLQNTAYSADLRGVQALYTFDEGSGVIVQDVSGTGVPLYLQVAEPITTTSTLDGVITDYPQEMLYSNANTLMSQVVHTNPSAAYFSTLDYFGSSAERRRLVQPVMTGVPAPQSGAGTTLSDLAALFRQDKPIYVLAELDATTFQKEPAEPQRILFDPRVPISFVWNIKPLEEREQDLTVKLFLEGIPLNGTEPTRIPIYTNVVHTYVGVRMFAYGTPIALYATLYASLTFALGGLATWAVPRAYAGVVALYSRRQQRKKAARRAASQLAVATRRYSRKTPGRHS